MPLPDDRDTGRSDDQPPMMTATRAFGRVMACSFVSGLLCASLSYRRTTEIRPSRVRFAPKGGGFAGIRIARTLASELDRGVECDPLGARPHADGAVMAILTEDMRRVIDEQRLG